MGSIDGVRFRRRSAAELPAVYRIFRRALFDYLFRIGQVDAATAADPPIDDAWTRQRIWMEHFATTAAEDWVAEDDDGRIVGWAFSTERDACSSSPAAWTLPRRSGVPQQARPERAEAGRSEQIHHQERDPHTRVAEARREDEVRRHVQHSGNHRRGPECLPASRSEEDPVELPRRDADQGHGGAERQEGECGIPRSLVGDDR